MYVSKKLIYWTLAVIAAGLALWAAKAYGQTVQVTPCANPSWNAASATLTCGSGGGTTPPPVVTPPLPTPSDPFAGCPAGTLKIDGQWGNTAIETRLFGNFANNIMSIRVAPPATWAGGSTTKKSTWVQYASGPVVREAIFSTVPCSFNLADALTTTTGKLSTLGQNRQDFSFQYRNSTLSAKGMYHTVLTPGKAYYINVRNKDSWGNNTCSIENCDMRGGIEQ